MVSESRCPNNSNACMYITRNQLFRQFQLVDRLWKQCSGQFQLIQSPRSLVWTIPIDRQSPRLFVWTIPINWKRQTSIVHAIPVNRQSLKSYVRAIPINSLQNHLSGQLKIVDCLSKSIFRPIPINRQYPKPIVRTFPINRKSPNFYSPDNANW